MKENHRNLPVRGKGFPGFIRSRVITGKAILVLLLAVIAIAFSLSNPQRTSSAAVKNTENGALPVQGPSTSPACATIPSQDCVTDANGNPICCSLDENGDRTCRFQSTSCQAFDNPCDPDHPFLASVNTTLEIHSHTDRHGGRHFHTHLEMHGTEITEDEFEQCNPDAAVAARRTNKGMTNKGFAFVKASTNSSGGIVMLVKNSSFNSSGPPPETFDDPLTLHIITNGSSPNFTVHTVLHFTENANGQMTSCVGKEKTSSCGETQ